MLKVNLYSLRPDGMPFNLAVASPQTTLSRIQSKFCFRRFRNTCLPDQYWDLTAQMQEDSPTSYFAGDFLSSYCRLRCSALIAGKVSATLSCAPRWTIVTEDIFRDAESGAVTLNSYLFFVRVILVSSNPVDGATSDGKIRLSVVSW